MKLTPIRETLLHLLRDGEFHSGEYIGEQLGLSRAAVSRHCRVLKSLGLDIFTVTGRGYRLAQPLDLYDVDYLSERLPMAPVHCFMVLESTSQYLLDRVAGLTSGESCLAESQTAARGRQGKPWVSALGCQLLLSFYWRVEQGISAVMGLSLAIGVAVVEVLEALDYQGVELKWPNDLYYQGRKLGGILVEMSGSMGDCCHLVIGIGLNIGLPAQKGDQIDQLWAELRQINPQLVDRNQLAAHMISGLQQAMLTFEQRGLTPFIHAWQRRDHFANRPVRLLMGEQVVEGIARGINEQGALRVETSEGVKHYLSGDISLRRGD